MDEEVNAELPEYPSSLATEMRSWDEITWVGVGPTEFPELSLHTDQDFPLATR